jgi:hypothetical protein
MLQLRHEMSFKERLLWVVVALTLASALWVLNVELTYERNIKHIPAGFLQRHHTSIYNWKA